MRRHWIVGVGMLVGAAGCGADDAGGPGTTIKLGQEVVVRAPVIKIEATNHQYSISALRAAPGENLTIALTSVDDTHDFVLDDGKLPVVIARASKGVTASGGLRAPDAEGTYAIYCTVIGHRGEGMEAKLIVVAPPLGG